MSRIFPSIIYACAAFHAVYRFYERLGEPSRIVGNIVRCFAKRYSCRLVFVDADGIGWKTGTRRFMVQSVVPCRSWEIEMRLMEVLRAESVVGELRRHQIYMRLCDENVHYYGFHDGPIPYRGEVRELVERAAGLFYGLPEVIGEPGRIGI